jgi:hypothetical protein
MKQTIFLICTKNGVQRMTKRAPSLYRNEVAVALKVTIPANVFLSPTIPAEVEITEGAVVHPTVMIEAMPHGQDEATPYAPEAPDGQAGPGEVTSPG